MKTLRSGLGALIGVTLVGCATTSGPEWQPPKQIRTFSVAMRQLPPEPVYSRLRIVRPPEVIPNAPRVDTQAPAVVPVLHLEVKDMKLDEVARVLASAAQYSSYCSSLVAQQTLSLNRLGTLDELGAEVEKAAQIRVIIDHAGRQVKFLAEHAPTAPRLY